MSACLCWRTELNHHESISKIVFNAYMCLLQVQHFPNF